MKKIGIFTSGGDAPGMNACVRAAVRTALYYNIEPFGIIRGYDGMINNDITPLNSLSVSNILQKGGTVLKSARSKEFMTNEGRKKAYNHLVSHGIEGLVAIGGDGTFTGAKIFYEEFGIPTVGAPGTIDNDLYGTEFTIGYDTAINTALDAIDKIRDTADSHDRVFFVEVMGRNSGYIAVVCGIAGGAEKTLIPETKTSVDEIIQLLQKTKKTKRSYIFVVAEGDEEGNAETIAQQVQNQMPQLSVRVSKLGHIQRGGSPTAKDRILASKMGMSAVEGLINGEKSSMVGINGINTVYVPFHDAIKKTKEINPDLLKLQEVLGNPKLNM